MLPKLNIELTIEQQFNLSVYAQQVAHLDADTAQEYLLELMRQLMIKDNVIKQLMKAVC